MRYFPLERTFFTINRSGFSALMEPGCLAVFTAAGRMPRNGDGFFPFRQQSDFFYLTGIESDHCHLILFPDSPNPALREILLIPQYDETKAIWEGHPLTNEQAIITSGIQQIMTVMQLEAVLQEAMNYAKGVYLNQNEYIKYFSETEDNPMRLNTMIRGKYPLHTVHRSAPLLQKLRSIKQETEIELLKTACKITGKAFDRILHQRLVNKMEFEVQAEIDHEFTLNRANGHAYQPIIAGGRNACVLHYIDNDAILNDGDLLLFDFGAEYANYAADMSRTIPVNGSFTQRQRACYEAVLRVFRQAVKLYVPGTTIDAINHEVWLMMESEMITLGLFSREDVSKQNPEKPLYRQYLMHGIAHPVGLDVHDVGSKFEPLKPGMVLTCEPGLYICEEKIGIRLENDILITENEPIDLMAHIPIDVDDIERIMQSVS